MVSLCGSTPQAGIRASEPGTGIMKGTRYQHQIPQVVDAAVRGEGMTPTPAVSPDATEVIKQQLTEGPSADLRNPTGVGGRYYALSQEARPWDAHEWDVQDEVVIRNAYHYLTENLTRDTACVAIEAALYGFASDDDETRGTWSSYVEKFVNGMGYLERHPGELRKLGLEDEEIEAFEAPDADGPPFRFNTYSQENHPLSQALQVQQPGGPYSELAFVRLHQGADVHGGFTPPRVYKTDQGLLPTELYFACERCGWEDAESCTYGDHDLTFQLVVSQENFDATGLAGRPGADDALERAFEDQEISGAVFHSCADRGVGHVQFR